MSTNIPLKTESARRIRTSSDIQRDSERRRQRKDEQRSARQRHAEQTAQALLFALDTVPASAEFDEWRGEINRLVLRIRKSGKRTPDRDAKAVAEALAKPFCNSVEDISDQTNIPAHDVQKVLDGMIAVGSAFRRPRSTTSTARGPQSWLYFLTDGPAHTDLVLP
ncbi:MAG TPA: hypothetical protein VGV59_14110 [Pyrinomonadaceae bacterium]|nr:hypothetical protein [Pyrinomonadaceae bacterium]